MWAAGLALAPRQQFPDAIQRIASTVRPFPVTVVARKSEL